MLKVRSTDLILIVISTYRRLDMISLELLGSSAFD